MLIGSTESVQTLYMTSAVYRNSLMTGVTAVRAPLAGGLDVQGSIVCMHILVLFGSVGSCAFVVGMRRCQVFLSFRFVEASR